MLGENYDKGFFWWDVVHPTSYGHQRIAEVLTGFLEEHLTQNVQAAAEHTGVDLQGSTGRALKATNVAARCVSGRWCQESVSDWN